jgi:hypothetical protein
MKSFLKKHWPLLVAVIACTLWFKSCEKAHVAAQEARQNAAAKDSVSKVVKLRDGSLESQKAIYEYTAKQLKDSVSGLWLALQNEKQRGAKILFISQVQAHTIDSLRGIGSGSLPPAAPGDSIRHGKLAFFATDSGKAWGETVAGTCKISVTPGAVTVDSVRYDLRIATALVQTLQLKNGIYFQTITAADPHCSFTGLQGDALSAKMLTAHPTTHWAIVPSVGIYYVPRVGPVVGGGISVEWDRLALYRF